MEAPERPADRTDRFLAAALIGILHGRSQSYLSDLMPNSFSMAPRYVREFVATDRLPSRRARRLRLPRGQAAPPLSRRAAGPAWRGPPRRRPRRGARASAGSCASARCPIEPAWWSRARRTCASSSTATTTGCACGSWASTRTAVDRALDDAHRLPAYLAFLREVLAGLREVADRRRGRGRSSSGTSSSTGARPSGAASAWPRRSGSRPPSPEGYRVAGVVLDDIAAQRKMTKIWGAEAGRTTKTDRLLVMAPDELGRRRALAGATVPVDWTWPSAARLGPLSPRRPSRRLRPGADTPERCGSRSLGSGESWIRVPMKNRAARGARASRVGSGAVAPPRTRRRTRRARSDRDAHRPTAVRRPPGEPPTARSRAASRRATRTRPPGPGSPATP